MMSTARFDRSISCELTFSSIRTSPTELMFSRIVLPFLSLMRLNASVLSCLSLASGSSSLIVASVIARRFWSVLPPPNGTCCAARPASRRAGRSVTLWMLTVPPAFSTAAASASFTGFGLTIAVATPSGNSFSAAGTLRGSSRTGVSAAPRKVFAAASAPGTTPKAAPRPNSATLGATFCRRSENCSPSGNAAFSAARPAVPATPTSPAPVRPPPMTRPTAFSTTRPTAPPTFTGSTFIPTRTAAVTAPAFTASPTVPPRCTTSCARSTPCCRPKPPAISTGRDAIPPANWPAVLNSSPAWGRYSRSMLPVTRSMASNTLSCAFRPNNLAAVAAASPNILTTGIVLAAAVRPADSANPTSRRGGAAGSGAGAGAGCAGVSEPAYWLHGPSPCAYFSHGAVIAPSPSSPCRRGFRP